MNQGNRTTMSKPFSHSSLGRDFMNVSSGPKFSQQGSRNLPSGPSSSKNLPSIFNIGNRAPPPMPSQPRGDPNQANKILASFGLSSRDLDELSRYPEEKITPESLPQLIQQIKRRRSEDMSMISYRERLPREPLRGSSSDWDDDVRPFRRESFVERSSGLDHVVDYDHGSRAREPPYRERLDLDDRLRDRERYRDDRFLSDTSFRKLGTDYEPMGYSQPQERSAFEKARGMPSIRNIDDFHGLSPKDFPYLCSLCDIPVHTKKGWHDHINGPTHKRHRLLLLDVYPDWKVHGMGDSTVLRQSTNHAPGLLGPPPPPLPPPQSLLAMGGGPEGRRVNQRVHLGMEDRGPGPGPRRFQSRPGTGRVVHIINFERGRNLKNQLLKLAEPFGEITNHLILNKMNEAFIEMSNTEDALAVVDYYSTNPALVMGKPACVHLSQKYKRIKKAVVKPETKPEPKKQETGSVVHLSKLPSYGYTDSALISLAESFGKVNTYILMRVRNQAFIEMERVEDAQDMVKRCEIVPLVFQGKTLKVDLSERYKKLVLRIPNKLIEQKEKSRKRSHSPDRKAGVKEKQKKTETSETTEGDGEGQTTSEDVTADDTVHTSEETDIVTDSCEPELVEEDEEEEEEEAAALLETSSSVADDEVLEDNEEEEKDEGEDQTEAQESLSSVASGNVAEETRKGASKFSGHIDDFVTLDEIGDEEDSGKLKSAAKSAEETTKLECTSVEEETEQENEAEPEEEENETCEMPPASVSETAQASVSTAETTPIAALSMDYDLGPYQPNNPVGVDFVVPKTGFYCKLCCLFYTNEDVAKVTHCSTLPHYQKLKKLLNKMAKNSENKN
ncbi:matrin-3 [Bufo gargarizans]|uniref:matrin-3 n=1 Tax=Bufo gargarizans TaxID=30331 RepID=UPI001CF547B8|nr:matrin-3 [Bufo gargarizans]XP_044137005.1 matrin-3 [Bufo gargarizans]